MQLHITALPGGHGLGDLGPAARAFVDWLAAAGQGWWQVLPLGPLGAGESPYSATSAFAAEPLLLSLDDLAEDGLLAAEELAGGPPAGRAADFAAARAAKLPRLALAAARLRARGGRDAAALRAFEERERAWLAPFAADRAARGGDAAAEAALQFLLERQWLRLRAHALARGVRLLGDLPLFVDAGAADVRAHPELFRLDAAGRPSVESGAPPDAYAPTGQRWGHPHYAWAEHRRTDFAWWRRRFARGLAWFDALRLDHFIGFHHAWTIPAAAADARAGAWEPTPGAELLERVRADHGALPLLAEDLGTVSEPVERLRDRFGLPGMRVLQWAFGEREHDRPHAHPRNSAAYTGTHDADTAVGWWRDLPAPERARAAAYLGGDGSRIAWDLVRACWTSPANLAFAPLQDLLGLGSEARFNVPGTPAGNWTWRALEGEASAELAERLLALTEASGRLAPR